MMVTNTIKLEALQWSVEEFCAHNPTGTASFDDLIDRTRLLDVIVQNFPGGMCVFDKYRRMILCNAELKRLLDYPDALFAHGMPTLEDLFRFNAERGEYGPGDVEEQIAHRMDLVERGVAHEYERERPNGTILEVRGMPVEGGGFVTTYIDVTERWRKTRQLEALLENFPGGISIFDEQLRMVLYNEKARRMLGYPETFFNGRMPSLEEIFRHNASRGCYGPGDVEELVRHRLSTIKQGKSIEYELQAPSGAVLEVRRAPLGKKGFVATYMDVTAQRERQAEIAYMAHHDMLTDLPNRFLFWDRLEQALARCRRGSQIALHYIDLDGFKAVNDNFGHPVGDELLKLVAQRLRRNVRESDTLARLGGDEFAVIQGDLEEKSATENLARTIVDALETPFSVYSHQVQISTSIGIAFAPTDATQIDEFIKNADFALYKAKRQGRGRFKFFGEIG